MGMDECKNEKFGKESKGPGARTRAWQAPWFVPLGPRLVQAEGSRGSPRGPKLGGPLISLLLPPRGHQSSQTGGIKLVKVRELSRKPQLG
jgi:hypothetical protein